MACHSPIPASQDSFGRVRVQWSRADARDTGDQVLEVSCGRCEGCRAAKAREWAIRAHHEAQLHTRQTELGAVSNNAFVTLTYADAPPQLDHRDFQLFMKRLRKRFGGGIRFIMCGEYGERRGRPHFHSLLFGCDFHEDRFKLALDGSHTLYGSPTLTELWPFGFSYIGTVNFATASYVAGYAAKKLRKAEHENEGTWIDAHLDEDGELVPGHLEEFQQEYIQCSRRPGIAGKWIEANWPEVYPRDEVVIEGKTYRPPEYYDRYLRERFPDHWARVLERRMAYAEQNELATPLTLKARKANFEAQASLGKRSRHENFGDRLPAGFS